MCGLYSIKLIECKPGIAGRGGYFRLLGLESGFNIT